MRLYFTVLVMLSVVSGCSNADTEETIEVSSVAQAAVSETPDEKPVVTVFSAEKCGVCQTFRNENHSDLPMQFVEKLEGHPDWIQVYPTFYWEAAGQWWKQEGWYGNEAFLKVWKQSQALGKKKDDTTSLENQSPGLNSPDSSLEKPQSFSETPVPQPQYLSPGVQGSCFGGRCGR